MLTVPLITITFFHLSSSLDPHLVKKTQCLETIITKEFKTDIAIVGANVDVIPESLPITLNAQNSAKNWIIHLKTADPLPRLHPKNNYLLVAPNESIALEVAERGTSKMMVVHSDNVYYRINPHFCKSTPLVLKRSDCKYPANIFRARRSFSPRCLLKVGYITSPPYVIDVTSVQNPGIMVSLIDLVAKSTKMRLHYQNSSVFDHEVATTGYFSEIRKALELGEIDIAIGHLLMNDSETVPFDLGPMVTNDSLWLSTPKPKKLKVYKKLFVVFSLDLWGRILGAIAVMVFIFYFFALCEDSATASFFTVMFDVFRVSLCGGVAQLPKWVSFRVLLVFFALFSLSLDTVYLGKLSQTFAFSSYDVNVDSLQQVRAVQMNFIISWRVERLLTLSHVYRDYPNKDQRLAITNHTQSFLMNYTALVKERGTILFRSFLDTHPSELELLDRFDVITTYLSLFVTYYLNEDAFFNEAFAFWTQEIIERGFIVKWLEDIKRSNIRVAILPEEEDQLVVLKLAHFEESFRVLLGGYALALGGLGLEFAFLKLDKMGFVRKVADGLWFVLMLLKPPELG